MSSRKRHITNAKKLNLPKNFRKKINLDLHNNYKSLIDSVTRRNIVVPFCLIKGTVNSCQPLHSG